MLIFGWMHEQAHHLLQNIFIKSPSSPSLFPITLSRAATLMATGSQWPTSLIVMPAQQAIAYRPIISSTARPTHRRTTFSALKLSRENSVGHTNSYCRTHKAIAEKIQTKKGQPPVLLGSSCPGLVRNPGGCPFFCFGSKITVCKVSSDRYSVSFVLKKL